MNCEPMGYKILKDDCIKAYNIGIEKERRKDKINKRKISFILRKINNNKILTLFGLLKYKKEEVWNMTFIPQKIKTFFFWNGDDEDNNDIIEYKLKLESLQLVKCDYVFLSQGEVNKISLLLKDNK